MKKLLLSLGALTAVVAPIAAVVACGAPAQAKPVMIDQSKAEAIVPKIQEGIVKAISGGDTSKAKVTGHKVEEVNGNFQVSLNVTGTPGVKEIDLVLSPEGKVTSANTIGTDGTVDPIPENMLSELKDQMKGQIVDHSNDQLEKFDFDVTKFDKGIMDEMTLKAPTAITSNKYSDVSAYNDAVEAFKTEYKATIASDALKTIDGDHLLTITREQYDAISTNGYENLDEAFINKLGLDKDSADKLKHLIDLGAKIQVSKSNTGEDLNGIIEGGDNLSFNWFQGLGTAGIHFKA